MKKLKGIKWGQNLKFVPFIGGWKEYYGMADKIEPHIAVAFPFDSDISDEELYEKLSKVVEKYKSLSDDIYRNIIPEHLEYRDIYNYEPHISLANMPLDEEIELDETFEMMVDSLYVERIRLLVEIILKRSARQIVLW